MQVQDPSGERLTGFPTEVPVNPAENARPVVPPVPVVYYDEGTGAVEYKVVPCPSHVAAPLEAELNALGKHGWRLVGILPPETQALFLFMRASARRSRP